ncbi:MAG: acetyl-CoA carboxylase biotin carboxyl carrier protein [Candidatus Omnitrophota bacterium]
MNLKEIKEMIALMNENNLTELEIEREGMRIKLKKGMDEAEIRQISYTQTDKTAPHQSFIEEEKAPPQVSKNAFEIKAPMVGTFYRTPSPEAPPFIEVGQEIEVGQVICIIEAMKLMNEIKSEVRGKILEICVDNAEPVEFGQVIFLIQPQ